MIRMNTDGYELLCANKFGPTIAHHRLIAYAHGELDDLQEPVEIDHENCVEWANYEANLQAVGPIDHGKITRARARARKRRQRQRA